MKWFLKDKNEFIKLLIVIPFLITFLLNTFYFSKKDNNVDTLNTNEINKDNNDNSEDNIINNNEEIKENNIVNSLTDYKIVYLNSSKHNEDLIAKELNEALKKDEVELKYTLSVSQFDNSSNNINLLVDESLTKKQFIIECKNNSLYLTSGSNEGLIEASTYLYNMAKNNSYSKVNTWFKNIYTGTYNTLSPISMMTYNVRYANDGTLANGDSGNVVNRAPRVIKAIKSYLPDTVGVQESTNDWTSRLKSGLMPQYGYTGWGRNSDLGGEACGIFYNRDKLALLDSGTYWLSNTPLIAGSKFNEASHPRIMTYGIFKRISDGYTYMHINTHLDLKLQLRVRDVRVINIFVNKYKNMMPIFLTGDLNCQKKDKGDAVDTLINQYSYIDAFDAVKTAPRTRTFPQVGYNKILTDSVIDFCLLANRGLSFTHYEVDTKPYSGDDIEKPQLTSDHYPIYLEAIPYNPITTFSEYKVK